VALIVSVAEAPACTVRLPELDSEKLKNAAPLVVALTLADGAELFPAASYAKTV
jgi:hypothetical protein